MSRFRFELTRLREMSVKLAHFKNSPNLLNVKHAYINHGCMCLCYCMLSQPILVSLLLQTF